MLPAYPNGLRIAVDNAARRRHVKLRIAAEADSLLAEKKIIHREGCDTVTSTQTLDKKMRQGVVEARRIVNPSLPRIIMVTIMQRPLSRAEREVSRMVRLLVTGSAV